MRYRTKKIAFAFSDQSTDEPTQPPPKTTIRPFHCPIQTDSKYKMFGNICYYFETQEMNFTDAQTSCETKFGSSGGKLFEPKDLATHNAVREKQVEEVRKSGFSDKYYKTWIGISDQGHEGTFTFVSDDAHLPFTAPWKSGQPYCGGSSNCDCVEIYDFPEDENYRNDHWADIECSWPFLSICEQI